MLVTALIIAAFQLAAAAYCYTHVRSGDGYRIVFGLALAILGFLASAILGDLLVIQFLVLTVWGLFALVCQFRTRTYLFGSLLGLLIVVASLGLKIEDRLTQRQNDHPLESLVERLKYETQATAQPARRSATSQMAGAESSLQELDRLYAESVSPMGRLRTEQLRRIHASQVERFANSPGFGIGRGAAMYLREPTTDERPPIDMVKTSLPANSDASAEAEFGDPPFHLSSDEQQPLQQFHRRALTDFANLDNVGWILDRQHVAGFQPHAFSRDVTNPFTDESHFENYQLESVELVSLLKHPTPVAYVSKHLPKMDELVHAPVRPLDRFELEGLSALASGEDILFNKSDTSIRMLGAIRAARQCVSCHTVNRGDLLGAFSYRLSHIEKRNQDRHRERPSGEL
jgi:hypothetical protein